MKSFVGKSIELLGEDKKKIPKFIFIFLSAAVLDMLGIGLIGPYVAMILNSAIADNFFGIMEIFFDI